MSSASFPKASPAEVGLDSRQIARVLEIIDEQVDTGRAKGVCAVVSRHGKVVLEAAVGVRNPDGEPMTHETVWPIASATKPLTATLIMQLVADGKVGLNQLVSDYLPELSAGAAEGLMVHHLLTHTGGHEAVMWTGELARRLHECANEDAAWGRGTMTNAFLGCLPTLKRKAKPGAGMLYNNIGYEMLGEIVRRVYNSSVGDALQARVLGPLGLERTSLPRSEAMSANSLVRLPGAPLSPESTRERYGVAMEVYSAADLASGGAWSTPSDYHRFCEMIRRGGSLGDVRVLAPAAVKAMTTNQIPGVPDLMFGAREANWGFGFSVQGHERWPYFGGALVSKGAARHAGAGGIDHWIDFETGISACYFEVITEASEMMEPISSAGHRVQDVVSCAVLD